MSKFLTVATDDGRSYRLVRVVALAAFIFGIFWCGVVIFHPVPDMTRARRQASELQALILQQPQFAEVRVEPFTNGQLVVFASDEMSLTSKAELARIVAQHAPRGTPPVSYLRHIDPSEPNPK